MEVTGVGRSIEKNKVRYTEYYGDGVTKSFSAVANVYGDEYKVKKQECIGHIQTRVGSRLRKLKKYVPGLGKLGLNDSVIDKLQNYYGMSVRGNVGNLNAMKKAIYALWCHVSSSKIISISIVLKERIVGAQIKLTLRMTHQYMGGLCEF